MATVPNDYTNPQIIVTMPNAHVTATPHFEPKDPPSLHRLFVQTLLYGEIAGFANPIVYDVDFSQRKTVYFDNYNRPYVMVLADEALWISVESPEFYSPVYTLLWHSFTPSEDDNFFNIDFVGIYGVLIDGMIHRATENSQIDLPLMQKEGYGFKGWDTDGVGLIQNGHFIMPRGDYVGQTVASLNPIWVSNQPPKPTQYRLFISTYLYDERANFAFEVYNEDFSQTKPIFSDNYDNSYVLVDAGDSIWLRAVVPEFYSLVGENNWRPVLLTVFEQQFNFNFVGIYGVSVDAIYHFATAGSQIDITTPMRDAFTFSGWNGVGINGLEDGIFVMPRGEYAGQVVAIFNSEWISIIPPNAPPLTPPVQPNATLTPQVAQETVVNRVPQATTRAPQALLPIPSHMTPRTISQANLFGSSETSQNPLVANLLHGMPPNSQITGAVFLQSLTSLLRLPVQPTPQLGAPWYAPVVGWAGKWGLIDAISFDPHGSITKQEIKEILNEVARLFGVDMCMADLYESLESQATRADAASLLSRLADLIWQN